MFINHSSKEVTAKIVYYGPGLSGKTSNLQYIFSVTNPRSRGQLVSIETDIERTLFFDLLPINVGLVKGYQTKFQLYTVPGQVFYDSTRKLVLKGADGVVFVCDSQELMKEANIESFRNLQTNLEEHNQDINEIPLVFQYNKRDLSSTLSIDDLNQTINYLKHPFFPAIATEGQGVIETLREISAIILKRIKILLEHSEEPSKQIQVDFDTDRRHKIIEREKLPLKKISAQNIDDTSWKIEPTKKNIKPTDEPKDRDDDLLKVETIETIDDFKDIDELMMEEDTISPIQDIDKIKIDDDDSELNDQEQTSDPQEETREPLDKTQERPITDSLLILKDKLSPPSSPIHLDFSTPPIDENELVLPIEDLDKICIDDTDIEKIVDTHLPSLEQITPTSTITREKTHYPTPPPLANTPSLTFTQEINAKNEKNDLTQIEIINPQPAKPASSKIPPPAPTPIPIPNKTKTKPISHNHIEEIENIKKSLKTPVKSTKINDKPTSTPPGMDLFDRLKDKSRVTVIKKINLNGDKMLITIKDDNNNTLDTINVLLSPETKKVTLILDVK